MTIKVGRHLAAIAVALFTTSVFAAGPVAGHPLDPITPDEMAATVDVLTRAGKVSENTRYPFLSLKEPDKRDVWRWRPGKKLKREAFVVLTENGKTYEAVVDLAKKKLRSFKFIPGVQGPILAEEYMLAGEIALSNPEFQAALARRGITDLSTIICMPLSAGYDANPTEEGLRLLRTTCLTVADTSNPWSRPIENLTAVVDLNNKVVVRVVDGEAVPMATENAEYPPAQTRPAPKPLIVSQPQGPDARIDGNTIRWDNWEFHARVEQREGVVISAVSYKDQGNERPVLYRGALGEIFVPYADATANWYFRTYMDEGEYGFGKSVQSLQPEHDCPANAQFIDVYLADDFGRPYVVPNGLCVFERTPHMAMRHFDIFTGQLLTRAGRELVVRFATVVGNYDYMMDWVFAQDGAITLNVGAGGVIATKGVTSETAQSPRHDEETLYGPLVDSRLAGIMHQHFFNVRLDMDIDGENNTLVNLQRRTVPANNGGRKSAWIFEEHVLERELDILAEQDHHLPHPDLIVANTSKRNKVGYPTGYLVETHGAEPSLLTENDTAYQRAMFHARDKWATRYAPDELYAAGDYPNQSTGPQGLPVWTAQNRSIKNKDLVLWVNVGLGHVPRIEDWPVMTTEWFGKVELKPFMFFDRNAAMDLSPAP